MKTNYDAQDGCVIRKQKNSHWIPQLPFPAFACSAVSRKPYRSPYPNPIVHHVSLALPAGTALHFASMTPLLLSAMIYLLECLQNCPNFFKKLLDNQHLLPEKLQQWTAHKCNSAYKKKKTSLCKLLLLEKKCDHGWVCVLRANSREARHVNRLAVGPNEGPISVHQSELTLDLMPILHLTVPWVQPQCLRPHTLPTNSQNQQQLVMMMKKINNKMQWWGRRSTTTSDGEDYQ